jgi:hypothetical protein
VLTCWLSSRSHVVWSPGGPQDEIACMSYLASSSRSPASRNKCLLARCDHVASPVGRTVESMNQFLALAYAIGGGAVGAGLNQYVTNIGQRRTARATVVANVSEVEAIYAEIMWPGGGPGDRPITRGLNPDMERCLLALEGAGLVAGIPRSILSSYILICRQSWTLKQAKSVVTAMDNGADLQLKATFQTFVDKHASRLGMDNIKLAAEIPESIERLHRKLGSILKGIDDFEKDYPGYHDVTLDRLRACLWHPIISKFAWREQRKLRQINLEIENAHHALFTETQGTQVAKDVIIKMADRMATMVTKDRDNTTSG